MMPNDPPDFDTVCRLLFVFHLGGKQYPCDMKIIDDYIESSDIPEATKNTLLRKRGAAVSAFIAGDDDTLGERLEDLAGTCYLLRKQSRDRPDKDRGVKTIEGASDGHEAVHGTKEEKAARWEKYRNDCVTVSREHPQWGLTAIRQEVADMNCVKFKTIQRQTGDLKELLRNAK